MRTQRILTQFISEELLEHRNGLELQGDDELLISGLIDSLGVMRLLTFIEEELDVEVPPEDVTIDNFRTISVISDYLYARTNST